MENTSNTPRQRSNLANMLIVSVMFLVSLVLMVGYLAIGLILAVIDDFVGAKFSYPLNSRLRTSTQILLNLPIFREFFPQKTNLLPEKTD